MTHTFHVVPERDGKIFVGTCAEYPNLSFVGHDEASTQAGIKILVDEEVQRINQKINARNFRSPWDEEQKP